MYLICSSSDGDRMYAYLEVVYYEVRYVNPKAKSKCAKQVNNDFDVGLFIYIYMNTYMVVPIRVEFFILEVDPWTQTQILAGIGTFPLPLLTYVPIETHIKGVPIHSSDKDARIRINYR